LPVPFGLSGFAAPVEEVYPSLVPFITLADGNTYAASDGADEIIAGADGLTLQTVNRKWARVKSKSGERFVNGLTSNVSWRIEGNKLIRRETVEAIEDVAIKNWRVAVPSTWGAFHQRSETSKDFVFAGRDGRLAVKIDVPKDVSYDVVATGDSRLSKGVLMAIPIHIVFESGERKIAKGEKFVWEITFEVSE
jgi:hypothetical protein